MQFFFGGGECVLVHGGRSDASLALCDCWLGRFSHDTTSVHWTQVRFYSLNIVHTTVRQYNLKFMELTICAIILYIRSIPFSYRDCIA